MPFGGNFHPEWGTLVPAPSFMRTARIVAVATAIGATAGAGVVLSLAGSGGSLGPPASADAAADKPLVIVHSLVQPAEAAPIAAAQPAPTPVVAAAPVNVPAAPPPPVDTASAATGKPVIASAGVAEPVLVRPTGQASKNGSPLSGSAQAAAPMPSDSPAVSTPAVPASVAALAEIPAATEALPAPGANQATFIPDHSGAQKVGSRKPRGADQAQQPHPQTAAATAQNPPKKKPEQRGFGSLLRHLFTARSASSYPN